METRAPRRFPLVAAAIVVAALIIGVGIYASSYYGHAPAVTTTSTTTTTATTTTTSTATVTSISTASQSSESCCGGVTLYFSGVSAAGLQLKMELNASTVQSRGALSAQIEVVNTLNQNASASMPPFSWNGTLLVWSGYDQICNDNPSDYIADYAVFQGHFDAGNISAAGTPLRLAPPLYPPCPGVFYPGAVTLFPNGDLTNYTDVNYTQAPPQSSYTVKAEANATTYYCNGPGPGVVDCGETSGLVGYWNGNSTSSGGDVTLTSPAFTFFPPGEYTIVATDPWNQYLYATFVVL